jgi:hypothetical protein
MLVAARVTCVLPVCCVGVLCRAQSDVLSEDMSEAPPHAGHLAEAGSGSFSNLQVGRNLNAIYVDLVCCAGLSTYCACDYLQACT